MIPTYLKLVHRLIRPVVDIRDPLITAFPHYFCYWKDLGNRCGIKFDELGKLRETIEYTLDNL